MNFSLSMQRASDCAFRNLNGFNPVLMPNEENLPFGRRSTPRRAALCPPTNAAHPRSEAMDTACNSDSDSDSQSRLDLAHTTAAAASMLLNLAAAAPENHGGRKRAASQAPVSNLDGIAWQHPIKQDAPSTGSRPSGGMRARSATPAMPPHNKRLRTKTNFFEAGAAPAPSALRRQQAP